MKLFGVGGDMGERGEGRRGERGGELDDGAEGEVSGSEMRGGGMEPTLSGNEKLSSLEIVAGLLDLGPGKRRSTLLRGNRSKPGLTIA